MALRLQKADLRFGISEYSCGHVEMRCSRFSNTVINRSFDDLGDHQITWHQLYFIDQVIIESGIFASIPQEKIETIQERAVQKLLTLSPVGLEKQDDSSLQNKNTGLCEFLTGHKENGKEVNTSVHSAFQEFAKTLTHIAQTYAQKQQSLEKGQGKDWER